MKRLYWYFRERTLNYQIHQIYMSGGYATCRCKWCIHERGKILKASKNGEKNLGSYRSPGSVFCPGKSIDKDSDATR